MAGTAGQRSHAGRAGYRGQQSACCTASTSSWLLQQPSTLTCMHVTSACAVAGCHVSCRRSTRWSRPSARQQRLAGAAPLPSFTCLAAVQTLLAQPDGCCCHPGCRGSAVLTPAGLASTMLADRAAPPPHSLHRHFSRQWLEPHSFCTRRFYIAGSGVRRGTSTARRLKRPFAVALAASHLRSKGC